MKDPSVIDCGTCHSTVHVQYETWHGRPSEVKDFIGPKLSPGTENAARSIVALNNERVVGAVVIADCGTFSDDRVGYLSGLKVKRPLRKQGVGTHLTQLCKEEGRRLGWDAIYLDTINDRAARVFIGAGAKQVTYGEMLDAAEETMGDSVRGYGESKYDYECWRINLE